MSAPKQQLSPNREETNEFSHQYIKRLHILDSFLCVALDTVRKALRQTEVDFLHCTSVYEAEKAKNEQLCLSNDALRRDLECARQTITTLDFQLYENGPNEFDRHMPTELDETFRLVGQLETEILQLKSDKLHMQLEHDQEIELLREHMYQS